MKQKLIAVTVFYDKPTFNPNEATKRLAPPLEAAVMAHVSEWRAMGCIVFVNNAMVEAGRLSREHRFDKLADEWVNITFVSLPLNEPDDITTELA
ncbi:MAG: hypothetical protein IT327_15400 [Anaerolineae bacterium]|nr:hypothetical protein [Anaerolineae bacterium]